MINNDKKDIFFNDIDKIPPFSPYKRFFELQKQKVIKFSSKKSEISFHIHTGLEKSGQIRIKQLVSMISKLPQMVSTAFNNKENDIDLIIDSVEPGSFIINIINKENIHELSLLDEKEWFSILDDILSVNYCDEDKEIEFIQKYGVKTFDIIKKWINAINKENIAFDYYDSKTDLSINFTKDKINKISQKLSNKNYSEENSLKKVEGKLVSINKKNIVLEDEKTNSKYNIKVFDNQLSGEISFNDQIYVMEVIEKKIINKTTKKNKIEYSLNKIIK